MRFFCFLYLTTITALPVFAQTPLHLVFKDAFYIGAALSGTQIAGRDSNAAHLISRHFNSISPENILKWGPVHPEPGRYNFAPADAFVGFGVQHNMWIVGHALVWHSQTPRWLFADAEGQATQRDTLLRYMREHIHAVVGRYKGRIHGWDVVNEAIEDDGQLRQSPFLKIIGPEYLEKAFLWAREADPAAELYYNDYNMWKEGKRRGTVEMVRRFQEKGVPIDGIGMQGHWGLDYPPLAEIEASIEAYAELGLKVMITELDLNMLPQPGSNTGADISQNYELNKALNPYAEALPDSVQMKITARYRQFFELFNRHADKISRVTFWGVHDGQSWLNNWPVRGRTAYPLLFDRSYRPKPAFDAVVDTRTRDRN